jgi:hypothetical protein
MVIYVVIFTMVILVARSYPETIRLINWISP